MINKNNFHQLEFFHTIIENQSLNNAPVTLISCFLIQQPETPGYPRPSGYWVKQAIHLIFLGYFFLAYKHFVDLVPVEDGSVRR